MNICLNLSENDLLISPPKNLPDSRPPMNRPASVTLSPNIAPASPGSPFSNFGTTSKATSVANIPPSPAPKPSLTPSTTVGAIFAAAVIAGAVAPNIAPTPSPKPIVNAASTGFSLTFTTGAAAIPKANSVVKSFILGRSLIFIFLSFLCPVSVISKSGSKPFSSNSSLLNLIIAL